MQTAFAAIVGRRRAERLSGCPRLPARTDVSLVSFGRLILGDSQPLGPGGDDMNRTKLIFAVGTAAALVAACSSSKATSSTSSTPAPLSTSPAASVTSASPINVGGADQPGKIGPAGGRSCAVGQLERHVQRRVHRHVRPAMDAVDVEADGHD